MVLVSCTPKYEVVQQVYPGMYHTVGVKDNEVILYKSDKLLKPGDIVEIPNKVKRKL
jgi:hypothetical protein